MIDSGSFGSTPCSAAIFSTKSDLKKSAQQCKAFRRRPHRSGGKAVSFPMHFQYSTGEIFSPVEVTMISLILPTIFSRPSRRTAPGLPLLTSRLSKGILRILFPIPVPFHDQVTLDLDFFPLTHRIDTSFRARPTVAGSLSVTLFPLMIGEVSVMP